MQAVADLRTARLAEIDAQGSVWLHSETGPVAARVLAQVSAGELRRALAEDLPVLVSAEPPVVVGVVLGRAEERARIALADGRAVLEAARELVLRCGAGSIRISADGTVRVDGVEVRSRARRLQRLTGAQVKIN